MATPTIVANWQARGGVYSNGTVTVPVANAANDWLIVYVSWLFSDDGRAVANVSDNSHNVYNAFDPNGDGMWGQVFVCPAARATTNLYVSTTTFVRDLHVQVIEVHGLAGYQVDASQVASGVNAASFTVSATATGSDFAMAFAAASGAPEAWSSSYTTVDPSTPGWGPPLHHLQPVPINPGVALVPGQTSEFNGLLYPDPGDGIVAAQNVTAGTVSIKLNAVQDNLHAATFAYYTGQLILFQASAPVVYSSPDNPAWPMTQVQAGFGYQPGDPSSAVQWTDISGRFLSLNGQRGRNFELDELSAADMTLELLNMDGALTPGNTGSPYYPNVQLVTPVRVLMTWQGTTYTVFRGLITALPSTYDGGEREIIKVALSDDFSKLPQSLLPSAMIADLIYDRPTHLWPLNDAAGSPQANNWSGRSTAVMVPVHSQYGTSGTPAFGQTQNSIWPAGLEGTSDTVWQQYSGTSGTRLSGTCLINRGDSDLPYGATSSPFEPYSPSGATYECWALVSNNSNNLLTGATIMALLDDKGSQAGGMYFKLTAVNTGTVGSPQTYMVLGHSTTGNESRHLINNENIFDSKWHHHAVTMINVGTRTQFQYYLDGQLVISWWGNVPKGAPSRLLVGGDTTVRAQTFLPNLKTSKRNLSGVGALAGFFAGQIADVAAYDRVLDQPRLYSHFLSGKTGWVGDLTGTRLQRVLTWSNWWGSQAIEPGVSQHQIFNYLGSGYASNGLTGAIGLWTTAGGAAAIDNGAQADVTIQDIVNSECGLLFVQADGTLTFRQRNSQFNKTPVAAMGDQDYALNLTSQFHAGLGAWTAANGTLTTSTGWSYSGKPCAQLTVTTGGALAFVQENQVVTARPAGCSAWVMFPGGGTAQAVVNWAGPSGYISSASGPVTYCPPQTPVILTCPVSAPVSGATTMEMSINIPAMYAQAGQVMYFDHPRLSPSGLACPYNDDVEITEDIQYLYNDVAVTRNIDQATYRAISQTARSQFFPRVYTRTIYTSEEDPQAVVDAAQWLLASYETPQPRVSKVTVSAANNPDAWPFVLGVDVGDVVTFSRNPVQGADISGEFIVWSIEPDIGQDKADFSYVLGPVPDGNSVVVFGTGSPPLAVLGW